MQQSCVFFSIAFFGNSLFSHLAKSKTPNSDKSPHHHIIRERPDRRCGSSSLSLSPSLSLSAISQCFELSEFPVKKEQFLPPGQIISERYMQLGCQISVFLKKI